MTIHYMKEQLYKMGFSETDPCTACSQNTTGTYLHALWRCSSQSSTFELLNTEQLYYSLGCRISTTLHRWLVVHSSTRVQCQYSPYSLNYRQEGYIFKLEMKELYKHCAMENSSSRSYIPGKKSASLYRKTSEFN